MKIVRTSAYLLFLFTILSVSSSQATIDYTISVAKPEEHTFRVTMTVPDAEGTVQFQLPAWNALYQIRDFAYHVRAVRAESGGAPLPVRKLDKQTWQVDAGRGKRAIALFYAADWDDSSAFSSQLNADHAFINFATILMYIPARREEDVRVAFADVPTSWKIAVSLPVASTANAFSARNYDALVDAPAELSNFDEFRFTTEAPGGVARIRVVVHSQKAVGEAALKRFEEVLRRIVTTQTGIMREAPFEEYMFLFNLGSGGGGMEHANSTAIHASSLDTAMGVSSHEFFHLWNVKRIRPKSLEPVDYTKENWTRALWFAEGVTSTYGNYTLVRSGLWSSKQFLDDLAGEIAQLESRPARLWKSVEEASLDAWFEKYNAYRRPAYSISYYNKGQILGVLLDILIREETENRKGLDDVLRLMNTEFARKGRYYDDSTDIRAAAERVAGRSFAEFFTRYVSGTDELPCEEILFKAGLRLKKKDGGGYLIEELADAPPLAARIRAGLLQGTVD
jgi:predicted metalloprotease with PDZ domain